MPHAVYILRTSSSPHSVFLEDLNWTSCYIDARGKYKIAPYGVLSGIIFHGSSIENLFENAQLLWNTQSWLAFSESDFQKMMAPQRTMSHHRGDLCTLAAQDFVGLAMEPPLSLAVELSPGTSAQGGSRLIFKCCRCQGLCKKWRWFPRPRRLPCHQNSHENESY